MGKRVWYISKYAITPDMGNPTRQYFLSKYLARKGNVVSLVSSRSAPLKSFPDYKGNHLELKLDGLRHVLLNGPRVDLGFNLKRIWSWLIFEFHLVRWFKKEKDKPDVVIVSSLSILTFLTGIYIKRKLKCKLAVEVRDIYPYTLIEMGGMSKANPLVKILGWIERKAYVEADWIIGTLDKLDDHIENIAPGHSQKFIHIPMGIDPDYYSENGQTEDLPIEFPPSKFIVGYVGSFGKSQATGIIFDAIKALRDDTSIHFLVVGEGPEKAIGLEKVKGQDNYTVLPSVPKSKVPQLLSRCNLVLNPWLNSSLYEYGISPNKWIDYMWAGKPILVSFNGYQRIISEAQCGKVVQAENLDEFVGAIKDFSEMTEFDLKSIGDRGREYLLSNLTYEEHSRKLDALFSESHEPV